MSPRLNVERTQEKLSWNAHEKYIEEEFPGRDYNSGWYQDGYVIISKIYADPLTGDEPVVVITSRTPPYNTTEEPYE